MTTEPIKELPPNPDVMWTFWVEESGQFSQQGFFATRTLAEWTRGNMGSYTAGPMGPPRRLWFSPIYSIRKPWLP